MFYKWLVQITLCLHWFNPIIYLMEREISRACELACDQAVIEKLDGKGKQSYGNTLLHAIGTGGNYKDALASITLNENKELLKERLEAIMNYKKHSKVMAGITVLLSVMICLGATVSGAYATPDSRQNQLFMEEMFSFDDGDDSYDDHWNTIDSPKAVLINTKQWPASGVAKIDATYASDKIMLLPSPSQNIILKEYLSEDQPQYYANTSVAKATLNIERGQRPSASFASRIEIYVPTNFKGKIQLTATSGNIDVNSIAATQVIAKTESGLIEMVNFQGALVCNSKSGIISVENSNISGTLNSQSGRVELRIDDLLGNIEAQSKSGDVIVNLPDSIPFRLTAKTNSGYAVNNFSNTFPATGKSITGNWKNNPSHHIKMVSASGDVEINKTDNEEVYDYSQFVYTQNGYYQDSFIIEVGWNIPDNTVSSYPITKKIALPDTALLTTYFSGDAKSYITNEEALHAIGVILGTIKQEAEQKEHSLTRPLIVSITKVPKNLSVQDLTTSFYQQESLVKFAAVYPVLTEKSKQEFADKIYQDGRISFFGATIKDMSAQTIQSCAAQAFQDGNVAFFSVVVPRMTQQQKDSWMTQAVKEKKVTFIAVLKNTNVTNTAETVY